MKLKYTIAALAATTLVVNAASVAVPNGDFEAGDLTSWTSAGGRAFESGAGTNYRLISTVGNTNTGDYDATHTGLGTPITADTKYTLSWDLGNGASGDSGSATWTVEIGTIDGGVFTSLATNGGQVESSNGNTIFFGQDNEIAGDDLVFTTGGTVSGDDLSVRISITNSDLNWAGFDNIALDASAVPEPSSAALLGLGGLALILRRRK